MVRLSTRLRSQQPLCTGLQQLLSRLHAKRGIRPQQVGDVLWVCILDHPDKVLRCFCQELVSWCVLQCGKGPQGVADALWYGILQHAEQLLLCCQQERLLRDISYVSQPNQGVAELLGLKGR